MPETYLYLILSGAIQRYQCLKALTATVRDAAGKLLNGPFYSQYISLNGINSRSFAEAKSLCISRESLKNSIFRQRAFMNLPQQGHLGFHQTGARVDAFLKGQLDNQALLSHTRMANTSLGIGI